MGGTKTQLDAVGCNQSQSDTIGRNRVRLDTIGQQSRTIGRQSNAIGRNFFSNLYPYLSNPDFSAFPVTHSRVKSIYFYQVTVFHKNCNFHMK